MQKPLFKYCKLFLIGIVCLFSAIESIAQSFTVSPDSGFVGRKLKVTITGNSIQFGNSAQCAGQQNCYDLGSKLKYSFNSGSTTVTGELPFDSLDIIDSHTSVAYITPTVQGNYSFTTESNLTSSSSFFSSYPPAPGFDLNILDSIGPLMTSQTRQVGISAYNGYFGSGPNCLASDGCIALDSTLTYPVFSQGSSTLGTIILTNLNKIGNTYATATVTFPDIAGNYYFLNSAGIYSNTIEIRNPKADFTIYTDYADSTTYLTLATGWGRFTTDPSCISDTCILLTDSIYYSSNHYDFYKKLALTSVNINQNKATVGITFPTTATNDIYYLKTLNGNVSANYVTASVVNKEKAISISTNRVLPRQKISMTISGVNAYFAQGSTCYTNNCINLGDHLNLNSGSSTISVTFDSINYINENKAHVTLTVPAISPGTYVVTAQDGTSCLSKLFVENNPGASYQFYPNTAEVNKSVSLTISSYSLNQINNTACHSTNCMDLSKPFLFRISENGMFKDSVFVQFTKVNIIDSNTSVVTFNVPDITGSYMFKSDEGFMSLSALEVKKPFVITKSISLAPVVLSKQKLRLDIEAVNFAFQQDTTCTRPGICLALGNELTYINKTTNVTGTLALDSIASFYGGAALQAFVIFPEETGTYYVYFAKDSSIEGQNVRIEPAFTVLTSPKNICIGESTSFTVKLKGKLPWNVTYSTNGVSITKTNITTEEFAIPLASNDTSGYKKVSIDSISDSNISVSYPRTYASYFVSKCDSVIQDLQSQQISGSGEVLLTWDANPSQNYCVQVAKDSQFKDIVDSICVTQANYVTINSQGYLSDPNQRTTSNGPTSVYYWRVAVNKGTSVKNWTAGQKVETEQVTTGIETETFTEKVVVYPVPAHEYFKILHDDKVSAVSLISLEGVILKNYSKSDAYSLEGINQGVYILQLEIENGNKTIERLLVD